MFSKGNSKTPVQTTSTTSVTKAPPSILSADLRIVGDLNSDGEIQIDGVLDGDVRTKTLLVGETAHIKGEIVADKIQVHGRVTGQLKARSVTLARTAHVVGDILHEDLAIENGAFLEGHCKRITDQKDIAAIKPVALKGAAVPPAAE